MIILYWEIDVLHFICLIWIVRRSGFVTKQERSGISYLCPILITSVECLLQNTIWKSDNIEEIYIHLGCRFTYWICQSCHDQSEESFLSGLITIPRQKKTLIFHANSPWEMICVGIPNLFSETNKKKNINLSSVELSQGRKKVKMKVQMIVTIFRVLWVYRNNVYMSVVLTYLFGLFCRLDFSDNVIGYIKLIKRRVKDINRFSANYKIMVNAQQSG